MGLINSKDSKKKIDEATSNSSLSDLRYVITERPKWKVFRKREIRPIPAYQTSLKPVKGCPCGNSGPCKQKITPKGVTIHYPQKKKKFSASFGSRRTPGKPDKGYYSSKIRGIGSRVKRLASIMNVKKKPERRLSRDFMFMPFLLS